MAKRYYVRGKGFTETGSRIYNFNTSVHRTVTGATDYETITRATDTDGAITDTTTSTTTFAWDAGTSGGNRYLVLAVCYENGPTTPRDLTALTYNGVSMAHIQTVQVSTTQFDETMEIWGLTNPATGSNDFVCTFDTSVSQDIVLVPVVYTGVDQTTPYATGRLYNDGSSGSTIAPRELENTVAARDHVVVFIAQNRASSNTFSAHDSDTSIFLNGAVDSGTAGFAYAAAEFGPKEIGGFYEFGYSNTGNTQDWVTGNVNLLPAESAPPVAGDGYPVINTYYRTLLAGH